MSFCRNSSRRVRRLAALGNIAGRAIAQREVSR